jgi:hypothetical protein
MYKLIGEKNERYYKFLDLKEDELMTLDFLTEGGAALNKKIKKMVKKIVKWAVAVFYCSSNSNKHREQEG